MIIFINDLFEIRGMEIEEIEEILSHSGNSYLRISVFRGITTWRDRKAKRIRINYPKLKFGMKQVTLDVKLREGFSFFSWRYKFETKNGYKFLLDSEEIESCRVLGRCEYPRDY